MNTLSRSKRPTKKDYIIQGLVYRQEVFLKTFLPHLEKWKDIAKEYDQEYYDNLVEGHDEFLWEMAEILMVSVYHWYETELVRVLLMLRKAPKRETLRRIDDIKEGFKNCGIHLTKLKNWQQTDILRKLANSLKHSGRYKPSDEFLKSLNLPLVPICDLDNNPTTYYGTLTSPRIQKELVRRLKISAREFKGTRQRAVLEASIGHIHSTLEELIRTIPDTSLRRLANKPISLTTFAV